jgi:uroporphyrin-III C-methyltransferase
VNEELLIMHRLNASRYMLERAEQLSTSQDEINRLLVDYALNYGHVVRLKGGDPFVFGRGGKKLITYNNMVLKLQLCQVFPPNWLTGLQQLPLTYSGISESFWVITGPNRMAHYQQIFIWRQNPRPPSLS